jgi:hypothetical protein
MIRKKTKVESDIKICLKINKEKMNATIFSVIFGTTNLIVFIFRGAC